MKDKLTSRKLWISVAAALASVGGCVAGMATGSAALTTTGMVCTMLSAAIYAAAEAYVDGKSAASAQTVNQVVTTKQVTATANDKQTVMAALAPADKEARDA